MAWHIDEVTHKQVVFIPRLTVEASVFNSLVLDRKTTSMLENKLFLSSAYNALRLLFIELLKVYGSPRNSVAFSSVVCHFTRNFKA